MAVANGIMDSDYQDEAAPIEYRSKVVTVAASGNISAWRWVILPFISLDHIAITSAPQVASDNNEVDMGDGILGLGSLAPSQHAKLNRLVIGVSWNKSLEVKYQQNGGPVKVLATTKVSPNYSAMIGLILLVLALIGVVMLHRRKRSQPEIEAVGAIEHT